MTERRHRPTSKQMRVLILGGTGEARNLAQILAERDDYEVILSLAGRTKRPGLAACTMRIGGFGGVDGLAAYLVDNAVDAVVNATHPFAAAMTAHAAVACKRTGTGLARLTRPAWQPIEGDDWHHAPDLEAAAAKLPGGARVFLAVGSRGAAAFRLRADIWFLVRAMEPTGVQWPGPVKMIVQPPAPTMDAELQLLRRHRIDHLVARNAGGGAGYAKIAAARVLHLSVTMIARPPESGGVSMEDAMAVITWLNNSKD